MTTFNYTKRAQDRLEISLVVEYYLSKITSSCKGAVAHAVSEKVDRMVVAKKKLEAKLEVLSQGTKGLFKRLKAISEVRRIKREIAALNNKMVEWLNVVYSYFLSK